MPRQGRRARPRFCIDRIIPSDDRKLAAADVAIKENPENDPRPLGQLTGVSRNPFKMAILTGKKWAVPRSGKTLGVHFLDGSPMQRQAVQKHARAWSKYANITLDSNADVRAPIRVSFSADDGAWSAVGTDCLASDYFRPGEPTMNFGWLKDDTDDEEYRRVVIHEFGHALAAIHEHQNPRGGIKWNTAAVYRYFSGPPNNWSREDIDHNVLQKYSVNQLNASTYDPLSIMLYSFPGELLANGRPTRSNTELSRGDKAFIKKTYPKP